MQETLEVEEIGALEEDRPSSDLMDTIPRGTARLGDSSGVKEEGSGIKEMKKGVFTVEETGGPVYADFVQVSRTTEIVKTTEPEDDGTEFEEE